MSIELPLKDMSLADKLRVMENLWADISREGSGFSPPEWHGDVLRERKEKYASGEIKTSDWTEAKKRIQERAS